MHRWFLLTYLLGSFLVVSCTAKPQQKQDDLTAVVEEMQGISMQISAIGRSDGRPDPVEIKKEKILARLAASDQESIPPLVKALHDKDVQMRRNACLVFIQLANPFGGDRPRVDIKSALPDLIEATHDSDADVRAWAALALGEMGPDATSAVPDLVRLLKDPDEGPRNTANIALSGFGPEAKAALPALTGALNDESEDVRSVVQAAISRIKGEVADSD